MLHVTQLKCINKTREYKLTKYSIPVQVSASVKAKVIYIYTELEIYKELPIGLIESFNQLLVSQATWINNPLELVWFAPDPTKYNNILDTTIIDVLTAHNKMGYLVAVSYGSVKHMNEITLGWVLGSAKGIHFLKSHVVDMMEEEAYYKLKQ